MSSKKIVLNFPKEKIDKPIVYKLIKDFNLTFNILRANITPDQEGHMVLELVGENSEIEHGIKYLKEEGISTQPLSKDIKVNWDKCIQCGACYEACNLGAIIVKPKTMIAAKEESIAIE